LGKYIIQRLLSLIPILLGVSIVIFLFLQLVPGDIAATVLGPRATPEKVEAIHRQLGLDKPIYTQYFLWLSNMLRGDMGTSIATQVSVIDLVIPKFKNTLILTSSSLFIAIIFGVLIGIISAVRQYSIFDRIGLVSAIVGSATPSFWLALILMYFFALRLGWFPTSGMYSLRGPGGVMDLLSHLVLPSIAAAAIPLAVITRLVRSSMLDVLRQDFITTLRAKGLQERLVIYQHAFRNALPPIISITGLQAGFLLGGALFVEVIFSWPGIGKQLYSSILARDVPVVQGAMLIISFAFVLIILSSDIFIAFLDPKIHTK
jgi:peptide/nickel transport system permease protein